MRPHFRKFLLISAITSLLMCCVLICKSNILLKNIDPSNQDLVEISRSLVKNNNLSLNDVLLVVRTSKSNQYTRLPSILQTWFQFSPTTTHIITNEKFDDLRHFLAPKYHTNIHRTACEPKYSVANLCCQSGAEFDLYYTHKYDFRWLCRFDDDQYVNAPRLIEYLSQFSPMNQSFYIGKPSWSTPKTIRQSTFWFATFGGGICYSHYLLRIIREEIHPRERFVHGCEKMHSPDDIYMAYLLHSKFNINLTIAKDFHHHIEKDLYNHFVSASNIDRAITLGFNRNNIPKFPPLFNQDTFRMRTLHCLLYPTDDCLRRIRIFFSQVYRKSK